MKRLLLMILSTILTIGIMSGCEEEEKEEGISTDVASEEYEDEVTDNESLDVEEATQEEKEETNQDDEEETAEESRDIEIETIVQNIIDEDLNRVEVKEIKVNENMGLDDGSYIVLPHLTWDVKNKEKTTREMLSMYSENIAAKLADESDVSEVTVFWEVPYHLEGDNSAKFSYSRQGDGMAIKEEWFAPVLR